MGILDSVGSLTKALDVGNYVKEAVDKVLPQNMHFVGDIAGAVTDYYTGNYVGAAKLGMDALKDLPQATKGKPQQTQAAKANALLDSLAKKPELEPSPPPTAKDPKSFDVNDLLSAIKALTAALTGHGTAATPATAEKKSSKEALNEAVKEGRVWTLGGPGVNDASRKKGLQEQPTTPAPATTKPAPATDHPAAASTTATSTSSTATTSSSASAATAKPEVAAKGESTAKSEKGAKPEAAAKSESPAPTAAAASSAKGQTISSLSQLQGMSDSAFMDAVRNARISPDVAKDPAAMMAIQERMNDITQMNNLMTAMMRAIHDMQMAIVQNIRI